MVSGYYLNLFYFMLFIRRFRPHHNGDVGLSEIFSALYFISNHLTCYFSIFIKNLKFSLYCEFQ